MEKKKVKVSQGKLDHVWVITDPPHHEGEFAAIRTDTVSFSEEDAWAKFFGYPAPKV